MKLSINLQNSFNINKETKSIRDVSVVTAGEAKGHRLWINDNFLNDLVKIANEKQNGVPSRIGHPSFLSDDPLPTVLGKFDNFRLNGNKVIADMQFIPTELNKNYIDHILTLAEQMPSHFGTSIVFEFKKNENGNPILINENKKNYVTIGDLINVDFVYDPAANPDGVFSQESFLDRINNTIEKAMTNLLDIFKSKKHEKEADDNKESNSQLQKYEFETNDGFKIISEKSEICNGDKVEIFSVDNNKYNYQTGSFQLKDGSIVKITDGVVKSFLDAELANELSEKLNAKNKEDNEIVPITNHTQINKPFVRGSVKQAKNPKLSDSEISYFMQTVSDFYENQNNPEFLQKNKIRKVMQDKNDMQVLFATGIDTTGIIDRCKAYLPVVFQEPPYTDLFSYINRLDLSNYYSANNITGVKIPEMFFPGQNGCLPQIFEADDSCSVPPSSQVAGRTRNMQVIPLQLNWNVCARIAKNVFNGTIYVNDQTIPAEAQFLGALRASIYQSLVRAFLYGIHGPAGQLDGLIKNIRDEITLTNINSLTQVILQPTPYDNTNAYNLLNNLLDLAASNCFVGNNSDLIVLMSRTAAVHFYRNFSNVQGNMYFFNNNSAGKFATNMLAPYIFPGINVYLVPMCEASIACLSNAKDVTTNPLESVAGSGVIITPPSNLYYTFQANPDSLNLFFDQRDRNIYLHADTAIGCGIGDLNKLVVNFN